MGRESVNASPEAVLGLIESSPGGKHALEVCRAIADAGFEVRFVGGCVRDAILGAPSSDLDICSDACPDDIARIFEKTKMVGKTFGVTLVILDGLSFEVSTYRTESDYRDFRHPAVCKWPVTLEEDASRRDFTVNAIYLDPTVPGLLDPENGLADLELELLRCVGDPTVRFGEDALRILRARGWRRSSASPSRRPPSLRLSR